MDPIFITNTVAEKAKKLKQPMFVAFIDFAEAIDFCAPPTFVDEAVSIGV